MEPNYTDSVRQYLLISDYNFTIRAFNLLDNKVISEKLYKFINMFSNYQLMPEYYLALNSF